MKRKTFYLSLLIIAVIGIGADVALKARRESLRNTYCPNGNCSKTVKEHEDLPREENALLGDGNLIAPKPEVLDESLDESLIDSKTTDENRHDEPSFIADKNATTSEKDVFEHNLFMFGLSAETKQSEVRGISFIAASDIKVQGKQDTLAAAGAKLNIDGVTNNDVYVAGMFVNFGKDSIQRDAYVAGTQVTLSGNILGSAYVAANTVILDGVTIEQNAEIAAANIVVKGDTKVYGNLKYNDDARTENINSENIGGIITYTNVEDKKDTLKSIFKWISTTCVYIISTAIFTIIIAALARKNYGEIRESKTSFKNFFKGLLVLVIIPLVAWLLSIISYFNVIGGFVMLLVCLGATVALAFVTIRLGAFVSNKILKAEDKSPYRDVLIGAITSGIILLVPVAGATVIGVLFLLNLGLITSMVKEHGLLNLSSIEDDKTFGKKSKK